MKAVTHLNRIKYVIADNTENEEELIAEATDNLKRAEGAQEEEISVIELPQVWPESGLHYVPATDQRF